MAQQKVEPLSREAVGIFDTAAALEAAVHELQSSGFNRADLSLLAGEDAVAEKLKHLYRKATDAEDDAAVPRTAYVSTESIGDAEGGLIGGLAYVGALAAAGAVVASGGTLAAVIASVAAAGGAGGLIGSVLAGLVGGHHADYLQQQLDRGGLLLWVRTHDTAQEARATAILGRHSAHDVHIHGLPPAVV